MPIEHPSAVHVSAHFWRDNTTMCQRVVGGMSESMQCAVYASAFADSVMQESCARFAAGLRNVTVTGAQLATGSGAVKSWSTVHARS
jgi:hypothetical protein